MAGLLTGEDVAKALAGVPEGSRCVLPDACPNHRRFLDGLTLAELRRPVEVVPADGRSLRVVLDRNDLPTGVSMSLPNGLAVVVAPTSGKSSLVNRIVGTRATVVEEEQGVTR